MLHIQNILSNYSRYRTNSQDSCIIIQNIRHSSCKTGLDTKSGNLDRGLNDLELNSYNMNLSSMSFESFIKLTLNKSWVILNKYSHLLDNYSRSWIIIQDSCIIIQISWVQRQDLAFYSNNSCFFSKKTWTQSQKTWWQNSCMSFQLPWWRRRGRLHQQNFVTTTTHPK